MQKLDISEQMLPKNNEADTHITYECLVMARHWYHHPLTGKIVAS